MLEVAQQQKHFVEFGFDVPEFFDLNEFTVAGQHKKVN